MKTIFYSWQSDLPNSTNRSFIQKCLEAAISEINDLDIELEVRVDQDTKGMPGTPDIAKSIFDKIDSSEIFVCDLSIINIDYVKRKTPNPNVLLELGYAAKKLGWENIICLYNTAFGNIEHLPFDLEHRRPLIYTLSESEDKLKIKESLKKRLVSSIISIHDFGAPKLKGELITLFNKINPKIIQVVKEGNRKISININTIHLTELYHLKEKKHFLEMIEMVSNGNILSNNINSTGGINDIGPGQLEGYIVTFKGDW